MLNLLPDPSNPPTYAVNLCQHYRNLLEKEWLRTTHFLNIQSPLSNKWFAALNIRLSRRYWWNTVWTGRVWGKVLDFQAVYGDHINTYDYNNIERSCLFLGLMFVVNPTYDSPDVIIDDPDAAAYWSIDVWEILSDLGLSKALLTVVDDVITDTFLPQPGGNAAMVISEAIRSTEFKGSFKDHNLHLHAMRADCAHRNDDDWLDWRQAYLQTIIANPQIFFLHKGDYQAQQIRVIIEDELDQINSARLLTAF